MKVHMHTLLIDQSPFFMRLQEKRARSKNQPCTPFIHICDYKCTNTLVVYIGFGSNGRVLIHFLKKSLVCAEQSDRPDKLNNPQIFKCLLACSIIIDIMHPQLHHCILGKEVYNGNQCA